MVQLLTNGAEVAELYIESVEKSTYGGGLIFK